MAEKEFLTDSGYAGEARKNGGITPAAEDYLEMICRLAHSDEAGENGDLRPAPFFAIARIPGWSAHRLEELLNANKIIRPAYKYVGTHTQYTPAKDR